MLTAHVVYSDRSIALHDVLIDGSASWSSVGDDQVVATVQRTPLTQLIFSRGDIPYLVVYDSGVEIWRGKVDSVVDTDHASVTITAYGMLKQTSKLQDITALYSSPVTDIFRPVSPDDNPMSLLTSDGFSTSTESDRITITTKKGAVIPRYRVSAYYAHIPHVVPGSVLFATISANLPAGMTAFVNVYAYDASLLVAHSPTGTHAYSFEIPAAAAYILVGVYCDVVGGYTVTAEEGTYYARFFDLRIASSVDTVGCMITSAITAGSNVTIPMWATSAVYPGDKLYMLTSASGEAIVIDSVNATGVVGSTVTYNHSIYAEASVPRTYATQVIDAIMRDVGLTPVYYSVPDSDILHAHYVCADAGTIIDDLRSTGHSSRDLKLFSVGSTGYIATSGTLPTYYADADAYTLEKVLSDLISSTRATYKTVVGMETYTGSVGNPTLRSSGVIRRDHVASALTTSGSATSDALAYMQRTSQIGLKSDFTVSTLYNKNGGNVFFPTPNANVVIRNIIPELIGVADYRYYLKSFSRDLRTGAVTYVIGEYIDSVETLLAGI